MNKIQQARARMLIGQVFFANILMSTPCSEREDIPTAATDMKKIWYNPKFFEGLSVDLIAFVFAHEVLHIAFSHGLRRGSRNPDRWNRACDYAINLILRDAGFTIWEHCLIDDKYKGMSAEQIYEILTKEDAKRKKQGGGEPKRDGLHGDVQDPTKGMDENERAVIERSIQQRVAQAANMARMAGKLPGDLARIVDDLLNPKAPWEDLLREFMTRIVQDDESWGRRNRRFQGIYLPTRYSTAIGKVVSIGDTSGSIGNDELTRQATEVSYICDNIKPEELHLIWADTRVAGEQIFRQGDPFTPDPKGGGGTDMCVPLAYAETLEPDVVILFTDGYTPWPKVEPPYPLIVCCTTNAEVPIGTVVRI